TGSPSPGRSSQNACSSRGALLDTVPSNFFSMGTGSFIMTRLPPSSLLILEIPRCTMQRLVDVADHMFQPDQVVRLESVTLVGTDCLSKRNNLGFCVGHRRGWHG